MAPSSQGKSPPTNPVRFRTTQGVGVQEEGGKLFIERHVVEVDGIKIGFFGIVDPDLRDLLAKSVLADFTFEDPVDAAARETTTLRADGVDAVVMLSNLHPRDNALVSREMMELDAIVADLHVRWAPGK